MKIPLIALALLVLGGPRPYTERGITDFDTAYDTLKKSGEWKEVGEGIYAFKHKQSTIPYRNGQWVYSDFGWTWRGDDVGSWATDHYGSWIRTPDGQWVWMPDKKWIPATVQWRRSGDYIGWRPCMIKPSGFADPKDTSINPHEWNFVLKSKLLSKLKSSDFASFEKVKELLEDSVPSQHDYEAWRTINRPGPDPFSVNKKITIHTIKNTRAVNENPIETLPTDLFCYRPKFHQDTDGIYKRIQIRIEREKNPNAAGHTLGMKDLQGMLESE